MNRDALVNVFGSDTADNIIKLVERQHTLSWDMKQVLSLAEGYPSDTSTQEFERADDLNTSGWDCHVAGKYEKALKYYDEALVLCPDFPMIWNNKGLAHYRSGDFDAAKQAYERAIALNALFIKPFSNMGILFIELRGDLDEGRRWLRKALALDPNYQRARAYLDQVETDDAKIDVLLLGTEPELAGGLLRAFAKRGLKVKHIP